jgi:hypothetical protein
VSRSPSYASQGSKSVFVEMSERSADTARLLEQGREAQPAQPPDQTRSLARRTASQCVHMLDRLGRKVVPRPGEARGQVASPGRDPVS